ncbi:MAG: ABC transporter permease subunit, partial [Actinobacteria bacterium]|nr:ABC transporter permease subunit [Actinomycetota bacterium]
MVAKPSGAQRSARAGRRKLTARLNPSDRGFRAILRGGGIAVLVLLVLVGTFLFYRGSDALSSEGFSKFITTQLWSPNSGTFGIAAVAVGTILIALVALVFAAVLSFGVSLFISEYAPLATRRFLVTVVDLMAAVPSVIFGLWGAFLVQWRVISLSRWISDWLGWIPAFQVNAARHTWSPTKYTSSTFIAGLVVALMITPVAASVMREAFSQAPPGEREGAYALGATRWGMIRSVVLPFGRGAIIGGLML